MIDYKKYKWFFTKSGKLVVGGKSAESNDKLLRDLQSMKNELVVMHTKAPGSPFCAIIASVSTLTKSDVKECATFTGCFSKAWKEGKKNTTVHMFKLSQLSKNKGMKEGSWIVKGNAKNMNVDLELAITTQNGVIRAIPKESVDPNEVIAYARPGRTDKTKVKIGTMGKINREQLLSALPAGGVKLEKA